MAHDLEKKWRSNDVRLQENVDFSALLLSERVLFGLKRTGFKRPSPIQLEAVPLSKIGKDVLVQAKSGTGKTLVFVITALEMLRRKLFRPQVMILVPTREIATQICSVIKSVGCGFPKLTCCSFIGGLSVSDDIENAKTCQIVVGTPGRLNQLVTEKALPTNSVRLLVFDEADRLLQMSFKDDINHIFNSLPEDKQVIATSATYPEKVKYLLLKYLREPHIACLNSREIALLGIIHYAKIVKSSPMPLIQHKFKLVVLEEILKGVKFSQCLVFCNGIQRVEVLYKEIKKWGFSAAYISSAKEQFDRLKAIDRLVHFKCKVLVSSDVTSRGIDAENVDLVINFDIAHSVETYMHRAGRAGRYGSVGVNITLVAEKDLRYLRRIEKEASFKTYKLPEPVPVDLIQNRTFGEYVIDESDTELNSDQESTKSNEVKTNISVANESNVIENFGMKSVDKNSECGNDTSDYVSSNQTISKEKSDVSATVIVSPFFPKAAIENDIVILENVRDSAKIDAENGQPLKEDQDKSIDENFDVSSTGGHQSLETVVNPVKQIDLNDKNDEKNSEKDISVYHDSVSTNKTIVGNILDASELVLNNSALSKAAIIQPIQVCSNQLIKENNNENVNENIGDLSTENVSQSFDILAFRNLIIEEQADLNREFVEDKEIHDDRKNECKNHSLEAKEIEIIDEKMCNSVSELYKLKDVKNCPENIDYDDIFESDIFVRDNLEKGDLDVLIKTFLNNYESDKNMELFKLKSNEESEETSRSEAVSICAINDLNCKKYTYVYEVCKKFEDEKNKECGPSGENISGLSNISSFHDKMDDTGIVHVDASNVNIKTDNECKSDHVNEQSYMNLVEKPKSSQDSPRKVKLEDSFKYVDASKCEVDSKDRINAGQVVEEFEKNGKSVIERPDPESLQASSNCENAAPLCTANSIMSDPVTTSEFDIDSNYRIRRIVEYWDKNLHDLNIESTLAKNGNHLFEEVSDSDSDDTEFSEEVNLGSSQFTSSEDSEESTSSSEDSYHHNKFRTGKQNPSLVSNSSCSSDSEKGNKTECEQNYYSPKYSYSNNSRHCHTIRGSCWKNNLRYPFKCSNGRMCTSIPLYACGAHSHCKYSVSPQQHAIAYNRSCFQPSTHRCHQESACNQMQVCSDWYKTFYNQWKHLQNCVNFVM